jgi:N-acetylglucosaminyldiphosphoundecaprenol N-acetyl-beta-D-mannosaminyltransferase
MALSMNNRLIVGMRVDASDYDDAAERVLGWARTGDSRYVCVGTVHMAMEANDDSSFREVVNGADLVTSDGMPLVWGLRLLGVPGATRVYGPLLTPAVCRAAAREGIPVGFHGATWEVLERLMARVRTDHPGLRIAYAWSPPFRPATEEEDERQAEAIAASGCRILFVGLGCPKQERWMAKMRGRIPAVMIGVGAAFDFLAGTKRQAPRWMQAAGLEWVFRLAAEPRRLWRRYLRNNPRFVYLFSRQLIAERFIRNGKETV